MRFPLGKLTVGDILDRGLKLLLARLPAYYLINLLVLTPVIFLQIAAPFVFQSGEQLDSNAMFVTVGVGLFAVLLTLILQPIGSAAILHIVMEEYADRRPSVGQAFSFALTRFAALLGTSILVGLVVVLGFIFCCIPGIYFGVLYAFTAQVVVLEKLSGGGAMQRSQQLVTGFWWRVFGVLLIIYVAIGIIQMAIGAALGFVLPSQEEIPAADGPRIKVLPVNQAVTTLVTQLVSILFTTYIAICTTLLYLDQRIRKEGFDLELATHLGEQPGGPPDTQPDEPPDDLDDPERRRRRLDEF